MAQPTPELQAAEVGSTAKWLDTAQRLGASHVRVFGGAVPQGAAEDQAVARAVETLKRCADEAVKRGMTLGVEDDGGITTTADRTVEIVKLDVGTFRDDAYYQIEMCAPYATNVHFKSQVHVNQQAQPADFGRILGILGSAGYQGYIAVEHESNGNPLTAVPELISKMRAAIQVADRA